MSINRPVENMARFIIEKNGKATVVELQEEKHCVLRCPQCNSRHGGEVADTPFISWRCGRCRWYIYGKVENCCFHLLFSSRSDIKST